MTDVADTRIGGIVFESHWMARVQASRLQPLHLSSSSHIQQRGIHVEEPSLGAVLRGDYQLIHFHWPEHVFDNRSVYKAVPRALLVCCYWPLLRRTKIIWTVHNLQAHAPWHAKLQRVLWTVFTHRIDGYIVLSESARVDVVRKYPHLAHLPAFVIPHGHYRSEYPDTVDLAEARKTLGLAPDDNVVLFFGAITPYKNVVALLEAFTRIPRSIVQIGRGRKAVDEGAGRADQLSTRTPMPGSGPTCTIFR